MTAGVVGRKLAAIVAADVVGYSRLMGADETGTLTRLRAIRQELVEPQIAAYHGRIVKLMGDGILIEFPSVVEALAGAVEMQRAVSRHNRDSADSQPILFRIGINVGDIIVEGDDIYGDGVNIAARLEGLAEPGGICISQMARDGVGNKLPLAYEDMGEQPVKNIAEPVRAYRVRVPADAVMPGGGTGSASIEPVTSPARPLYAGFALVIVVLIVLVAAYFLPGQPDPVPSTAVAVEADMAYPLPDKPSIAVLPFNNMSADPTQDYLSDGITESIITTLAKVPDLFVIARNSTFTYKGKSVPVKQVAEEQGVRYVLEGSVQKSANRIRINAQLIDALSGYHLWAEQYDREFSDIFELQDDINRQVMTELQVKLTRGEEARIWRRNTANTGAYTLFLRGVDLKEKFAELEMAEAQQLFKRALTLDSEFADAWAWLGWTYLMQVRFKWVNDSTQGHAQALESLQKALAIDNTNPTALGLQAEFYLGDGNVEPALALYEKVLSVYPNDSMTANLYGDTLCVSGRYEEGLKFLKDSIRLSPYAPHWFFSALGRCHFALKDYKNAVHALEKARGLTPDWHMIHVNLAFTYMEAGAIDKAQAAVKELLKLEPTFTLDQYTSLINQMFPFQNSTLLDRQVAALRKAGVPE